MLDEHRPQEPLDALELLARELVRAVEGAAWSISVTTEDGTGLQVVRGVASALDPHSGVRMLDAPVDDVYPLADFPTTARALAESDAFVAARDVPGSDPAELATLDELGYDSLLAVGAVGDGHSYLLELYGDRDTAPLAPAVSHARVLADYCMRRARRS